MGGNLVRCGWVEVENAKLRWSSVTAGADPVQPKEGPLVPSVEHLEGVNGDPLPTGITNCRSRRPTVFRNKMDGATVVRWVG